MNQSDLFPLNYAPQLDGTIENGPGRSSGQWQENMARTMGFQHGHQTPALRSHQAFTPLSNDISGHFDGATFDSPLIQSCGNLKDFHRSASLSA
jgi:hypothetical protein